MTLMMTLTYLGDSLAVVLAGNALLLRLAVTSELHLHVCCLVQDDVGGRCNTIKQAHQILTNKHQISDYLK